MLLLFFAGVVAYSEVCDRSRSAEAPASTAERSPADAAIDLDAAEAAEIDEAEIAKAQRDFARAEIEGTTNGLLRDMHITGLAHAEADSLEVRTSPAEACSKSALSKIRARLIAKKLAVDELFERMRCKSGLKFGDELKLR